MTGFIVLSIIMPRELTLFNNRNGIFDFPFKHFIFHHCSSDQASIYRRRQTFVFFQTVRTIKWRSFNWLINWLMFALCHLSAKGLYYGESLLSQTILCRFFCCKTNEELFCGFSLKHIYLWRNRLHRKLHEI